MDIIESVIGKLNINLGDMNNPNITIEGIKIDNSDDSSDDEEEEEEEEEDDEEGEEEEDDDEEGEEENENIIQNNSQNNNQNNNQNNGDGNDSEEGDESDEENNEEEDSNEDNNQENNQENQIFNAKKKQFILELNEFQYKHTKKYSKIKEKKCPICLLKYKKSDIIKELPCNHIFHKNCILKWIEKSNICPICKYDITGDINNIELKNTSDEESKENDNEEEEEEEDDD